MAKTTKLTIGLLRRRLNASGILPDVCKEFVNACFGSASWSPNEEEAVAVFEECVEDFDGKDPAYWHGLYSMKNAIGEIFGDHDIVLPPSPSRGMDWTEWA